jgi:hypothetical protein
MRIGTSTEIESSLTTCWIQAESCEMNEALKNIRSRARALIQFSYRMEKEELDDAQREREMNMARAHCKGITDATHGFLRVAQPEWQKLDHIQRRKAVMKAFAEERALHRPLDVKTHPVA